MILNSISNFLNKYVNLKNNDFFNLLAFIQFARKFAFLSFMKAYTFAMLYSFHARKLLNF